MHVSPAWQQGTASVEALTGPQGNQMLLYKPGT